MDNLPKKTKAEVETWKKITFWKEQAQTRLSKKGVSGRKKSSGDNTIRIEQVVGELEKILTLSSYSEEIKSSFNKKLSAFVELNNLLSKNYQYFQLYPVRGFNLLVGATYSF